MELVVAGNAYLDGNLEKCCIGIEQGKIAAIKKIMKGDQFYDFGDKLILPAGTDIHVHFRDPGLTHKEDFETGSLSAAFGGIACVFDMPNTIPPVTDLEALEDKIRIAQHKAYIDFGLYSAVTNRADLKQLYPRSSGLKLYLGETTGKLTFQNLSEIKTKLTSLTTGPAKVLAVHAEQAEALTAAARDMPDDKYTNMEAHSARRPAAAETLAVQDMIKLNQGRQDHNIKMHFCHISSGQTLEELKKIKGISSEVTPHHIFLSTKSSAKLGTYGKVNPPVRSEEERIKLWHAFCSGEIPIIASDHAPHTISEKDEPFAEAPSGLPGVECILPLLFSQMKHGNITLDRIVDAAAVQPAELFGLNKGHLKVGMDADLIVIDSKREEALKANMLHSKCEWTPYENMPVIFPLMTIAHGKIIIKEGGIEGSPGNGIYQI